MDKETLTKAQKKVFDCLIDYQRYKTIDEIALYLKVSNSNIKSHSTEIYFKEGVKDRVELLLKYAHLYCSCKKK